MDIWGQAKRGLRGIATAAGFYGAGRALRVGARAAWPAVNTMRIGVNSVIGGSSGRLAASRALQVAGRFVTPAARLAVPGLGLGIGLLSSSHTIASQAYENRELAHYRGMRDAQIRSAPPTLIRSSTTPSQGWRDYSLSGSRTLRVSDNIRFSGQPSRMTLTPRDLGSSMSFKRPSGFGFAGALREPRL